jgi:polyisoprenoid-binding protein YceI
LILSSFRRFALLGAVSALGLFAVACAAGTGTTNPAVGTATPAQPPKTVATAAPKAAPTPGGATTPAAASPTVAPKTEGTGGATTWSVVQGENTARYIAEEQLVGRGFNRAVGTTRDVTGQVVLNSSGQPVPDQSKISIDMRTLRSDSSQRDSFIQGGTLQTSRFPTSDFVIREIRGLPATIPTSGQQQFQLVGDMTIRGVTRQVTWDATGTFNGGEVSGTAKTTFNFNEWGVPKPSVASVLSIEDNVALELDFKLRRG